MKKNISVVPFYPGQLQNRFFGDNATGRDNVYEPYHILKQTLEQEYNIATYDIISIQEADIVLFFARDYKKMWTAVSLGKKCAYISFEPPVVDSLHEPVVLETLRDFLGNVVTWDDDLAKKRGFFKFYPPVASQPAIESLAFSQKKLLVNISGNKRSLHPDELYSERIKAIRYFEKQFPAEFDLYGVGWNAEEYPSYRGMVDSKQDTLCNYKFSLCYDNMKNVNGMVSEKIFDCFFAKCIPVYLGTDNIEEYVPKDCFIDRREFTSYDELSRYLQTMSEGEYNRRIREIEDYLQSESFYRFSGAYFAQRLNCQVRDLFEPSKGQAKIKAFFELIGYHVLKKYRGLKSRVIGGGKSHFPLNVIRSDKKIGEWNFRRIKWAIKKRLITLYLKLRYKDLSISSTTGFVGFPVIDMADGSKISIGETSVLVSDQYFNTMGLSHRVILRTMRPGAQIKIGKNFGMSGGTICARELVEIGDNVGIGANCTIIDSSMHPTDPRLPKEEWDNEELIKTRPVIIEDYVMINMNVTIMPGVHIGHHAVIGANSTVVKDVPPYAVYVTPSACMLKYLE